MKFFNFSSLSKQLTISDCDGLLSPRLISMEICLNIGKNPEFVFAIQTQEIKFSEFTFAVCAKKVKHTTI